GWPLAMARAAPNQVRPQLRHPSHRQRLGNGWLLPSWLYWRPGSRHGYRLESRAGVDEQGIGNEFLQPRRRWPTSLWTWTDEEHCLRRNRDRPDSVVEGGLHFVLGRRCSRHLSRVRGKHFGLHGWRGIGAAGGGPGAVPRAGSRAGVWEKLVQPRLR